MDIRLDYFLLHQKGSKYPVKLYYAKIASVRKVGNDIAYRYLETGQMNAKGFYLFKDHFIKGTIKDCHLLKRPEFMRIHNSYIIHLCHVVDIVPDPVIEKKWFMLMDTGEQLPIAKAYLKQVKEIFFPHGKIRGELSPV